MKDYSLPEIAAWLGGEVCGDNGVKVSQIASLRHATAGQITFLTDTRYLPMLAATKASAVLVSPDHASVTALPRILVKSPYVAFAKVSAKFNPSQDEPVGIDSSAQIADGCTIGANVSIGAHAVISQGVVLSDGAKVGAGCYLGRGVEIGTQTLLNANVSIYSGCKLGDRCIVHSGTVIGADGFGYAEDDGQWVKIPQIGCVLIGHDVEIGANTTIDRGALDDTLIEDGVKIDNLVQIGHNCRIGAHTVIAGCVGIAGSASIGKHCKIGGAAMVLGHLEIAEGVTISPGSMITRSIPRVGTYTALMPFQEHSEWLKTAAQVRRLEHLVERVSDLEKELKLLKGSPA